MKPLRDAHQLCDSGGEEHPGQPALMRLAVGATGRLRKVCSRYHTNADQLKYSQLMVRKGSQTAVAGPMMGALLF